ncbi:MAG: hypothetical protein E7057_06405, partial [Lentisphaerae bacterium]|nr:hypothetical protein [Lentisphaerota bacterium]
MEMLAKYIRMRTARSAATASHPCVERSTEGINQYREQCLWHSFRSLAAYCSSSAHPRDICRIGFARMEMLAKYIRMRTARSAATASHPCVERSTEGINQYREQ